MVSVSFDLERFVVAQAPVMHAVQAELARGRKASHWMWFVFPQIAGLGGSPTARRYAIGSLPEAMAYLAHPVLGARLRECVQAVLGCGERDLGRLFGSPDDLKFVSSMTLFATAAEAVEMDASLFAAALDRMNGGRRDERTLALLRSGDR